MMQKLGQVFKRLFPLKKDANRSERQKPLDAYYYDSFFKKINNLSYEERLEIFGRGSRHNNGYVREEALQEIKNLKKEDYFPYVIERLNDWVPQVRHLAQALFLENFQEISCDQLFKNINLLTIVFRQKRVDEKLKKRISARIFELSLRKNFFDKLKKCSEQQRSFVFQNIFRHKRNNFGAYKEAIIDPSRDVRFMAARFLSPLTSSPKDLIEKLLEDKSAKVRNEMFKNIPLESFNLYKSFFERALFDDARLVRKRAQRVLKEKGYDVRSVYLEHMPLFQPFSKKIRAYIGFCEVAHSIDADQLLQLVQHPKKNVRYAAIAALERLTIENREEIFLSCLEDSSSKVRVLCANIIDRRYVSLLLDRLIILLHTSPERTKILVIKLLSRRGGLGALRDILWSLSTKDKMLHEVAWQCLESWYHKNAAQLYQIDQDIYRETLNLFEGLLARKTKPPYRLMHIWNDLPALLKAVEPK
jgi:HEAT repeat protein